MPPLLSFYHHGGRGDLIQSLFQLAELLADLSVGLAAQGVDQVVDGNPLQTERSGSLGRKPRVCAQAAGMPPCQHDEANVTLRQTVLE